MTQHKSVFITGAAAGIGRATALAFADRGYTVGGYDLDEPGLASLRDEIAARGATAVTGHLDVTDLDEMTARVDEFSAAAGNRLDVMVNNAGILVGAAFSDIDPAAHHKLIDVNCKGVINGLHAAFPHLESTPGAVVVNLASASAIYGQAELAVYSATKFFIRAMTEALDLEWGPHDIRVIDMWPLFVRTAMTEDLHTGTTKSLGIRLTPEDVAAAILAAVEPSQLQRALHTVHFPVGALTKVAAAGHFLPATVQRTLAKLAARA